MKHLLSMVAMMMSATVLFGNEACCTAVNTLTAQERQEGWQLLWDGKSGDGWRSAKSDSFPTQGWEIANGELTVLAKNAGGGAGDIITREIYSSFILKLEFRLTDAANSGVKYFFDPKCHGGTTLEYQVIDPKHPGAGKGRDGNRMVASLYDVLPAVGAKLKPVGEWNTAMIVSKGKQVEHWLNGEKVLTFGRGSETFRKAVAQSKFKEHPNWGEQEAGHILLQDHNDRVSYRNIKIKVL
jgi:hypothetical protein